MAKPKISKPGKVLHQVGGLRIRLTSKGQYGIYAGKHLFSSYYTLALAIKTATRIYQRKPTYYSTWKTFESWKATR